VLPHRVSLIASQRDFDNFLAKENNFKVKMLLFSTHKREGISSLYKHVSSKYENFIDFAQTSSSTKFEESLMEKYAISSRPSIVIFKQNSEDTVIFSQTFSKDSLEQIIEDHKFLDFPEISTTNFNYICGKKSKFDYCGIIFIEKTFGEEISRQKITKMKTFLGKLAKSQKIKFGYITKDFEKFAEFFNISKRGDSYPILFLDIRKNRHTAYTDPLETESMEIFLRSLTSVNSKSVNTPRNIPSLIKYNGVPSFFDGLSIGYVLSVIVHFVLSNGMIVMVIVFTLLRYLM